MARLYSRLISAFTAYHARLKRGIVTSGLLARIGLLFLLAVSKLVFVLISLPYFLFVRVPPPSGKKLESLTVSPRRYQQVLVLSLMSIAAIAVSVNLFSGGFFRPQQHFYGAPDEHLQLSGAREFEENFPLSIDSVTPSPLEHSVTVEGTGPSYAQVMVYLDNGRSLVGTTTVDGNGRWRFVKTGEMGIFEKGTHSVFAVFHSEDNMILGEPTPVKTFIITGGNPLFGVGYFGITAILLAIVALGFLGFSVVRLKKAGTA
jgi:hypothetical protein